MSLGNPLARVRELGVGGAEEIDDRSDAVGQGSPRLHPRWIPARLGSRADRARSPCRSGAYIGSTSTPAAPATASYRSRSEVSTPVPMFSSNLSPRSTARAHPGVKLAGRVSYIDPQVSPDTRTARVRVEVPNPRQELRLGMYADIEIETTAGGQGVMIPRSAVQNVGDRQVVYVANPSEPGKFAEREVRLGETSGDQVEVVSGVKPGDRIVSKGSFFVRAERERLGLGSAPGSSTAPVRDAPNQPRTVPPLPCRPPESRSVLICTRSDHDRGLESDH